jgi:TRAP-type mannitol/chloroaromatic compound transport system permease small subunit
MEGSFMILDPVVKGINALNEWVGKAVSWLFLALVAAVCIDLFTRYFTGKSTDWAFDINYMIYGTNFMLAGAYAMKNDSHVRVDVLYQRFRPRTRAILDCFFLIVIMLPLCLFMLNATWIDFTHAVEAREVSIVSSWHPPVYHYKAVMPLAFALLTLQTFAKLVPSLILAVKGEAHDIS